MNPLFRRIQPAQKFRITIGGIARLLKIPKHLIIRIESWAYVLFIHRRDKGGQFISYRKLQQWFNAIAYQIQTCTTCQQLQQLWVSIIRDSRSDPFGNRKNYKRQYDDQLVLVLGKIWKQRWDTIANQQQLALSAISL
jgi:hypothetical protein